MIFYEQPATELLRVCLRIEQLGQRLDHGMARLKDPWATRAVLLALVELIQVLDRPDFKAGLLKSLNHHQAQLAPLLGSTAVDTAVLAPLLTQLETLLAATRSLPSRPGQTLLQNDLINTVRQHLFNPGGGCIFDAPRLHFWLHRSEQQQTQQLTEWLAEFTSIRETVQLLLLLLRDGTELEPEKAENGLFQRQMLPALSCQLVRVGIPKTAHYYPEISVSKHWVSIRLVELDEQQNWVKVNTDCIFQLACCN